MKHNILEIQPNLKRQFPINLVTNFASFALNVGVGIWLTPYLIGHIGIAAYGIVPLATSITAYMSLFSVTLNGAVSRYLTLNLQRNTEIANQTFNTALIGSIGIVFFLLPVICLFSYFVPDVFNIPFGQEASARLFFLAVMMAFLFNVISSNFGVSSFAMNRLDLKNLVEVLGLLVRVFLIILFFNLFSSQLHYIGLSYLIGTLVSFIAAIWMWKKLTPEIKIHINSFSLYRLRELLNMGGWMFINQIAMLLFLNIDLIVVNKLFGAKFCGEYASVLLWSSLLRTIAGTVAGVLTPTFLIYYAHGKEGQLADISKKAVKLLGLAIALPIGLVCGFASPLLSIWLGSEFSKLAPLMWLLVGHLCINLAVLPLFSLQVAFNKVRIPGVVTLIMGIANLSLAILLPILLNWGIYGVATAGAIILTLKNAVFTPLYGARILNKPLHEFISVMLPSVFSTILIAAIAFFFNNYFQISNWIDLITSSIVISVIYILITFSIILKRDDRKLILSLIPLKSIG